MIDAAANTSTRARYSFRARTKATRASATETATPIHASRLNPTSRPPRKTRYVAVMSGSLDPVARSGVYLFAERLRQPLKPARNRTARFFARRREEGPRAAPQAGR
jgi:hypothetical protein